MPPRSQRGYAANVRAWDIFSSLICALKRQIAQDFLHLMPASEPPCFPQLKIYPVCATAGADQKRFDSPNEQQRDSARTPPANVGQL
jgi:hypothetical protein